MKSIDSPPRWLASAVTYQIFIDRFFCGRARNPHMRQRANKPVFCGGNLQGVAEKMDYLVDLGINTIWVTPFTKTANYHGYHVTDFYTVDEHFGGRAGFEQLLKTARANKVRLIMDFVPNHLHITHPWFIAAKANTKDPRREWFFWKRDGSYKSFLHYKELPKLNLDHPDARAEITNAAKYWLDQGIDGFRLDHVLGPSFDFWQAFRTAMKQHKPNVALIAEIYFKGIRSSTIDTISLPGRRDYLRKQKAGADVFADVMREYAGLFDGMLDFHFQDFCRRHIAKARGRVSLSDLQAELNAHYRSFPGTCLLLSFLDNHDMNRFLFECRGDKQRFKTALEFQFAQNAPPVLYYGTEAGMTQKKAIRGSHGDLEARRLMPWNKPDRELFGLCKQLVHEWKRKHRRG